MSHTLGGLRSSSRDQRPAVSPRAELEPETKKDLPDRWAQIRMNAATRVARLQEKQILNAQNQNSHEDRIDDIGSEEETIKSRVARIKARVVELTGATDGQPNAAETTSSSIPKYLSLRDRMPQKSTNDGQDVSKPLPHEDRQVADFIISPRYDASRGVSLYPSRTATTPKGDMKCAPAFDLNGTPKIDVILAEMRAGSMKSAFDDHGISDLWLPLPKQIVRRFSTEPSQAKTFMELQNKRLDKDQMSWTHPSIDEPNLTLSPLHVTLDDDEDIVMDIRVLGEGAIGLVEEVSTSPHDKQVICVRKRIGRPKQLQAHKKIMAAFAREVSVMRQVRHHHCVRFLGSYTDAETVNIISTPVADMDLATFLDRSIGSEERRILYKGIGCLCTALNYLHRNSIRHEDLKPQNVLIHGDNILLTDFGFSLDFSDDSVSTTTGRPSAWTIRYSAPEVLEFEPRNRASDIFSLGCVLTEMLSGIHGYSLSQVKNHWKQKGNGQSSFARNPEAVASWLAMVMVRSTDKQSVLPDSLFRVLNLVCDLVPSMLDPNRRHRPSSQQIVDRHSDLIRYVDKKDYEETFTCCASRPLIVGDSWFDPSRGIEYCQVFKPWFPPEYLYPSLHDSWAYILLDLRFNIIASKDTSYFHRQESLEDWYPEFSQIKRECQTLFDEAYRAGTTKGFWQTATEPIHINNVDATDDVEISARLLSLKHVVFTFWNTPAYMPVTSQGHRYLSKQSLQISLLPVCVPRSPVYGAFFYMLSFKKKEGTYPYRNQIKPVKPSGKRFVDLTRSG